MSLLILLSCSEHLAAGDPPFRSPRTPDRDTAVPLDTGSADSDPPADTEDTGDAPTFDTGEVVEADPCDGLTPGMCWVRTNPMVISGLVPSMGAPPASAVDAYFDDFGANTAHVWITGLPAEVAGWRTHAGSDFRFIAWLQNDGTSAANGEVLGGVGAGADGLVAYQVGDEPEDLAALREIGVGVDAVRAADPDALVIVNFSVGKSEIDEMFDYFADDMAGDIVSYDRYSYDYGEYENMMAVREAGLEHGLPYWRYLRSFEFTGATPHWPEISDLRWQVYSGLTYGFTGHHWFVYQVSSAHTLEPAFFTSTDTWTGTTEHFDQVAELNRELLHVGQVITQLTSTGVGFIPAASVYTPENHADWTPGTGGDPYLSTVEAVNLQAWELQDLVVGLFEDDEGERYIMVLNGNHEGADWPLWTHDRVTVELEFDFSGAGSELDDSRMELLDPETGAVYGAGLDGGALRVELLAGEAVLMKYATDKGWAGLDGG